MHEAVELQAVLGGILIFAGVRLDFGWCASLFVPKIPYRRKNELMSPGIQPGPTLIQSMQRDIDRLLGVLRQRDPFLLAASWVTSPLWEEARWSGTAYQFDRHADSAPVMGLRFERPDTGQALFKTWTEKHGNRDELEEIRITVIEGEIPGEELGYWIHIGPDPENSLLRAMAEGIAIDATPFSLLGQMRRMHRADGIEPMLPRFKELFDRHGEFLLARLCPRDDGRLWVDLEHGIVKHAIHFQRIEDLEKDLLDALSERLSPFVPSGEVGDPGDR